MGTILPFPRGGRNLSSVIKPAVVLAAACLTPALAIAQTTAEPPNAPAPAMTSDSQVRLSYQGRVLFEGRISTTGGPASLRMLTDSVGGRVTQVLKWTATGNGRVT